MVGREMWTGGRRGKSEGKRGRDGEKEESTLLFLLFFMVLLNLVPYFQVS